MDSQAERVRERLNFLSSLECKFKVKSSSPREMLRVEG